jgi:hypothetical protein
MSEPQNYVWGVVNKITGITLKIFYDYNKAEEFTKTSPSFFCMRLPIE